MKTLNLYAVTFDMKGCAGATINVAATTPAKAKKQTDEYFLGLVKVIKAKRLGNINVPVV